MRQHLRSLDAFCDVDTWIFDLDNTLYPEHINLFAQVDVRMRDFVQRLTGSGPDEAHRLQKDYYRRYGTTLRGLMLEHGVSPEEFLKYVHDIDHSAVQPDPELGDAIDRLPGRKFIMTNGTVSHAEKVANRLGITGHFEDIFDIVAADHLPKPHAETYDRFLTLNSIDPTKAAMFEDLPRNLTVPHDLGMRTVLIVPRGTREVFRESWELEGSADPHIEFIADGLAEFLGEILAEIGRPE
ncbi:putative hydrolase of the HAD superfamily [Rhodobium orientis]|uniref:pyrimidine 5'-nucleotidase n=1 Tax=Rhodobium orientis TaxID=34017 RepID=UPI0017DA42FD|nr:pyrimidine 5'-nucleotidase [Rhodobium orientis]MBB4304677.1 putative hydrolase of the HAD superfamily [Rhodobium orientis]